MHLVQKWKSRLFVHIIKIKPHKRSVVNLLERHIAPTMVDWINKVRGVITRLLEVDDAISWPIFVLSFVVPTEA